MTTSAEDIERLFSASRGYNALFLSAGALENACEENPENLSDQGVCLVLQTLADDRFESRRTSLFFYGRLARILTRTAKRLGPLHPTSRLALNGLAALAARSTGNRHLALCGACALLAPRNATEPPPATPVSPVTCTCHELLREAGLSPQTPPTVSGRSLLYEERGKILVIKCARPGEPPEGLSAEWLWMQRLGSCAPDIGHIPTPIKAPLLNLTGLPEDAASNTAIAFVTTPAYYSN